MEYRISYSSDDWDTADQDALANYKNPQGNKLGINPFGIELYGDELKRYLEIKQRRMHAPGGGNVASRILSKNRTSDKKIYEILYLAETTSLSYMKIAKKVGVSWTIVKNVIERCTKPTPKKCPTCGNMVYMPCIACRLKSRLIKRY